MQVGEARVPVVSALDLLATFWEGLDELFPHLLGQKRSERNSVELTFCFDIKSAFNDQKTIFNLVIVRNFCVAVVYNSYLKSLSKRSSCQYLYRSHLNYKV